MSGSIATQPLTSPATTAAATGSTNPAGGGTNAALTQLSEDFDNFLVLLTTQLQNQDPTSPMESTEFTNQLIGFTNVEQAIAQNDKLDELIALNQQASSFSSLLGFLDQQVVVEGNRIQLSEDTEAVPIIYNLDSSAAATVVNVVDRGGRVIWSERGETLPGRHQTVWDGTDQTGTPVAEGSYRVQILSQNANGEAVGTQTFQLGIVDSVEVDRGEPRLVVNGTPTDPNDVISVVSGG